MGANAQTTVPDFVAETVLTAAKLDISAATGVPVFATTVTRDAAFGGANKVLAEGQTCYLEDSNIVQYYDGAAWASVGAAAAVYGRVVRTAGSVTTTSTALVDLTGATITFTTGANPVAYSVSQCISSDATGRVLQFNINIDGTLLYGTTGLRFADANAPTNYNGSFSGQTAALSAGSHTIKVQWSINTGTGTVTATAATAAMFAAHEIT